MHTVFATAHPGGGRRLARAIGALLIAAGLLVPSLAARADHQTRAGLYTETHYIGVQFAYQFQWSAPWEVDLETIASETGEFDRIIVSGPEADVRVLLRFEDDLDDALQTVIEATARTDADLAVVGRDEGVDGLGFPYVAATLAYEGTGPDGDVVRLSEYIEVGRTLANDLSDGIRVVSLLAPAGTLGDIYTEVQATFVSNLGLGGSFFAGRPASEGDDEWNRTSNGGRNAPSDRDDEETSAAEAEYVAELERQIEELADSVERFYALVNDPDFGDQASIDELEEILTVWTVAPFTASMLTPPPAYEEVNAAFVSFTEFLYRAAEAIFDADEEAAVANLRQAEYQLDVVIERLDDAGGVDLLDRPSGLAWAGSTMTLAPAA